MFEEQLRAAAAIGWDAAVAAMQYEDGTPVEIVTMVNPYREETEDYSAELERRVVARALNAAPARIYEKAEGRDGGSRRTRPRADLSDLEDVRFFLERARAAAKAQHEKREADRG